MKNKIPHSSSPSNQEIMDSYDFLANSASTQDCTGLIPCLNEKVNSTF